MSATTPLPTKVALVSTLAATAVVLGLVVRENRSGTIDARDLAPILWFLTALFALRVGGQVLVVLRRPRWLPPMQDWNLVPYPLLLPIQVVCLAVMAWIDLSFSRASGPPVQQSQTFGRFAIAFGILYAGVMVIRYGIRMWRRPGARWWGGTIPIVFHLVLATYLYALGAFHLGR